MNPRRVRLVVPAFPVPRRAVYRLDQVIHVYRLRIRAYAEERPCGVKVHTIHPRRFTAPPVLPHPLGIRQRKDTDDRPLV